MSLLENAHFSYLVGTGRTATHWMANLIGAAGRDKVASFHRQLGHRARIEDGLMAYYAHYFDAITRQSPEAEIYVECNSAFLERAALAFEIENPLDAIPDPFLSEPAHCAWIIRRPEGYATSIKAHGWAGDWWEGFRGMETVYGIQEDFSSLPIVEQAARAWAARNEYLLPLVDANVPILWYDDLFGAYTTRELFICRVGQLFDWMGIDPATKPESWWRLKKVRLNAGNEDNKVRLTDNERALVNAICEPVLEKLP